MYTRLRDFAPPVGRALRVGLTGGIGTGKSTVAEVWASLGARTLSADALARQVVEPGTDGLAELVGEFGQGILTVEGALDRSALARLAFAAPAKRRRLEQITHPRIQRAASEFFEALEPSEVGVYDVPLLAENRMEGGFDVVVVVEAPLETRLDRLADRGVSREDALLRIAAQASDQERRALAHFVIDNSRGLVDLRAAAELVAAELGISR